MIHDGIPVTWGRLLAATAAATGAACGLLGVAEAAYHVGGFDWRALVFGFGLYAALGLAAGPVVALPFLRRVLRAPGRAARFVGSVAGLVAFGLTLVSGSFFVYRDVLKESLSGAGLAGWGALGAVLVGGILAGVVASQLGRVLANRNARNATLVLIALATAGLGAARLQPIPDALGVPGSVGSGALTPVIVVVADALRADAIEPFGATPGTTPQLAAFAQDAVSYTNAWSTASWTRPATASILTGRYPAAHQAIHKSDRLPADVTTLAEQLREVGYAAVASVTNVNLAPIFGLGRGFEPYVYHAPRPFLGAPGAAGRLFAVEVYRLLKLRLMPGHRSVESYYAPGETVLATAQPWLEELATQGRPFFAYLHFMEPHDPYFAHPYRGHGVARVENPNPPVDKADEYRGLYDQEVTHWDGIFGELVATLKKTGLYDRALIAITADHGEEFADHGGFWHGTTLFEELVRVPLLIRFPGGAGAGTTQSAPVSLVDLVPTARAAAGMKPDPALPGWPLTPTATLPADRAIFAEEDHQGCVLAAVRRGSWKLITANADNPRDLPTTALFDLATDAREQRNRTTETAKQAELEQVLKAGPGTAPPPSTAKPPDQVEIDPAMQEQLRSLGYTE